MLIVLTAFGAALDFVVGLWLIMNPPRSAVGIGGSLPEWYLLLSGLFCFIMSLTYVWIITQILKRAPSTQILVQVISVINISFAIFRFPLGAVAVIINIVGLVLVSDSTAKNWFSQTS